MAAQLIVVSDNRTLSLGLTGLDYDVLDLRPQEFHSWLESGSSAAVLVVSVEQPADAMDIVTAASDSQADLRILLVASDAPGWSSIARADDARLTVLPLPVTRLSLASALQRLASGDPAAANGEAATSPTPIAEETVAEPIGEIVEVADTADDVPAPPVSTGHTGHTGHTVATPAETEAPVRHMVAARSTDALRARLAERAATAAPTVAPAMDDMARPPTIGAGPVGSEAAESTTRRQPRHAVDEGVPALVRALLASVDNLYDVRDAALAVVEECVGAAAADAGVLLLPDGGLWRVCGAVGVRPLEWRYVVEPDSWLVTTVVHGNRGVLVDDSDIARQRLGGAPLTHHAQLMAVPVPHAEGFLLVAREEMPFSEDDLSTVAEIASDAGSLLVEALLIRSLARALGDFRAVDN
jgi:hypothetical protein